jgi:hypothetical protein
MDTSQQIELVIGAGGLLAIMIPRQLTPQQMSVVYKIAPDFVAKTVAARRWGLWALLSSPDWTGLGDEKAPASHSLFFA